MNYVKKFLKNSRIVIVTKKKEVIVCFHEAEKLELATLEHQPVCLLKIGC